MNTNLDLDDDLGSAMGTETLLVHDLVLDGFLASSRGTAEYRMRRIGGTKYLVE
jgi:hypothetical protein